MAKHVHQYDALKDAADFSGGDFSIMKGFVYFFSDEVPKIDYSKALTATKIMVVEINARKA